jgi:uncharacterized membrane protein
VALLTRGRPRAARRVEPSSDDSGRNVLGSDAWLLGEPGAPAAPAGRAAITVAMRMLVAALAARLRVAWLPLVLGASVAGLALLDGVGERELHPLAILALQSLVPALVCAELAAVHLVRALRALRTGDARRIGSLGAGSVLPCLCALHVLRSGLAGSPAAVGGVPVVLGVLLDALVLGERAMPRHMVASALVLAGALLRLG